MFLKLALNLYLRKSQNYASNFEKLVKTTENIKKV